MVLYNKQGEIIAVYPYGSEEQWRYERVLEILLEADKKRLDKVLEKRRLKKKDTCLMSGKIQREGRFWVYIVRCKNDTYYTGYTSDIEQRIALHNSGHGAKYLRGRGPVTLVFSKEYHYCKNALDAERKIKKYTRFQKEELIAVYERNNNKS